MIKTIKILIIDDHQLVRDGIKTMLTSQTNKYNFNISEAECSEDAITKVLLENFDVILVDYQLPDIIGPELVKRILEIKPKAKLLALSSYDEYACVLNMKKAGARGYVLKNISPRELVLAIETLLAGKKYYAAEITEKMIALRRTKVKSNTQAAKHGITKRQVEILKLVSAGLTNDEISKKLKLAKRTIDTHRQNLLTKLGVNNTAALIKKVTELAIL